MQQRLPLMMILLCGSRALADAPAPEALVRGYLDALNAGDVARLTRFHDEHDTKRPGGPSSEERAHRDLEAREQTVGGIDLERIVSSSPTEVKALLVERGGAKEHSELTMNLEAGRIAGMRFRHADGPPAPRVALPALMKDVDQVAETLAKEDQLSGVILVAKDGKPIFQKAYGLADRAKKIPNRIDTKFRIGSMNKMFTSVAIAQLVQAGKLAYTDRLAKVLPDYPDKEVAAKVTVHQLLTHTAGLGDFFGPEFDKKMNGIHKLADYLPFFTGKPLEFEPGTSWAYSNAGMIVAGLVVERVSGQSYFDYVRDHIYNAAGMKDSGFSEKTHPVPNQSQGYMRDGGKWVPNDPTLPLMGSSAGGGDSTAPDLLAFDQALRHHVLLDAAHTDLILAGKVDTPRGSARYAYGFEDDRGGGMRVVGHGGGAPGMNGKLDMYWDAGITVIVLANLDPPAAQRIAEYIHERIQP